jgi:hypothetical protein
MKCLFLLSIILPVSVSCQSDKSGSAPTETLSNRNSALNPYPKIGSIPPPAGYERFAVQPNSFADYLRKLPLKKDRTVHLYDGEKKSYQGAQFAVVDLPIGDKDLQQCADVIMRLRAEYFFQKKQFDSIRFTDNANNVYTYSIDGNERSFEKYLEKVFSRCGTLSLQKELVKRSANAVASIGDVLIEGGSPGHAMLIVDMAVNRDGEKRYLLLQGFMPAQEMHVVKNVADGEAGPWYIIDNQLSTVTPGWIFPPHSLRNW